MRCNINWLRFSEYIVPGEGLSAARPFECCVSGCHFLLGYCLSPTKSHHLHRRFLLRNCEISCSGTRIESFLTYSHTVIVVLEFRTVCNFIGITER